MPRLSNDGGPILDLAVPLQTDLHYAADSGECARASVRENDGEGGVPASRSLLFSKGTLRGYIPGSKVGQRRVI